MTSDRERMARWAAVALGLANASVTAFWLLGGTALLSTVGGEIERWGRERSAGVLAILALVLVLKGGVAVLPLVIARIRDARWRRLGRFVGWAAATVLVLYGGLLTAVGLLVQFDVLRRSSDADDVALAWHAYFWDPWFLVWGIALACWLRRAASPRREANA